MKTKISTFIVSMILLLFGVSTVVAQGTKASFKKDGETVFESAIADIDSIVFKQTTVCEGEYVIINGVKWATRNVGSPGAFVANLTDYGGYYQWNRGTTDFLLSDDYYSSSYPNSTTWLSANDPSPAGYRVPTLAEIESLNDSEKVDYEWTIVNGVTGGKFTDRTTGSCIFLPAAGCRVNYDGTFYLVGSDGYYWSSTQLDGSDGNAYYLYFYSGGAYWSNGWTKSYGRSVRPVAD